MLCVMSLEILEILEVLTSPMMLTRPGLRATKSGCLLYRSLNFASKLSHRLISTGNASSG